MKITINVVHLIATNFVGGPEKQIIEHGKRLDSQYGFNFCLISFVEGNRKNELLEKASNNDLKTRSLETKHPFHPRVLFDLSNLLSEENCDVLVTHGYKANIIGRLVTWKLGLPQIAVSRGWTAEDSSIRFYEKLDRFFLRFMNHIVAVSYGQRKKILVLGLKPEKISVIHNAINLSSHANNTSHSLRKELGVEDSASMVVGAGRLSPEKNFAGFIEAARLVLKEDPSVIFVIFGEGVLRQELESQILRNGLERNIFLPGFIKNLGPMLGQSDVFFQTSFTEGLPNVVLEAFAAKRAVVATDVGGTSEVVEGDSSGYLVRPDETGKMADHILHLLSNSGLRRQMGQYGYEFVGREFTFSRQTEVYLNLYRCLTQQRKKLITQNHGA